MDTSPGGTGDEAMDPTGDTEPDPGEPAGSCAEHISPTPLRRLSAREYENTIRDLLEDRAPAAVTAVTPRFSALPLDGGGAFARMDERVSQTHIDAQFSIATTLADAIVNDEEQLAAVAGDCALDPSVSDACIEQFAQQFGARAYRRPLTDDDLAPLLAIREPSLEAREVWRSLLISVLMSPWMLYHVEVGTEPVDGVDGPFYALSGYELASRLSYHFWQTLPDQELTAAAADGSLLTAEGFAAQVERLLEDDRTKDTIADFYGDWYRLGGLPAFANTPAFAAFAEGTAALDPEVDLIGAMADEVEALAQYHTWSGGTVSDLLLTQQVFTDSAELAELYGTTPWDGVSEPPMMPEGERAGLLTRAAFLVSGNDKSGPVHRGAFVLRKVLCQNLPTPDPTQLPDGSLDAPKHDGTKTTRELYEEKTSEALCAACHTSINSIGFSLEAYDGLGRFRTEENVFDDEGALLGTLDVDTAVEFSVAGQAAAVDGPVDLMNILASMPQAGQCFGQQYFKFTYRREQGPDDACASAQLEDLAISPDSTIEDILEAVTHQAAFKQIRFAQ